MGSEIRGKVEVSKGRVAFKLQKPTHENCDVMRIPGDATRSAMSSGVISLRRSGCSGMWLSRLTRNHERHASFTLVAPYLQILVEEKSEKHMKSGKKVKQVG